MKEKRLIQVYAGDGKGKSTAAIGQAIRAVGRGLKVVYVTFFKHPLSSGEFEPLRKLGIETFSFAQKHPHCYKGTSFDEVRKECLKGIEFVSGLFTEGTWDMLILDELNIAVRDSFLKEEEVLALLEAKPEKLELILTGRGATEGIIRGADLVSEVKKVKHPYDRGVRRRKGIEY